MKPTARILKFKSKVLRTPDDVSQVNEALFNDLLDGRVTPAEAKKLQREIKPVIDSFRTTLRAAVLQDELRKRLSKYE
jgi:hypothetical protein